MTYYINGEKCGVWRFKRHLRKNGVVQVEWVIGHLVISKKPMKLDGVVYYIK